LENLWPYLTFTAYPAWEGKSFFFDSWKESGDFKPHFFALLSTPDDVRALIGLWVQQRRRGKRMMKREMIIMPGDRK